MLQGNHLSSNFKESLYRQIPSELHNKLPRGFEVVGSIAIIEIDEELENFETLIAQTLLEKNKHIITVVKKASHHEGKFRTQTYEVLEGENSTTTQYRENGVLIELDINKTYFSTKLSTERENLAKQVKPHTNQLILFSGVAPYTFVITKQQPNISHATSIELNPDAHTYALKNLENNKNNLKRSELFKWIQQKIKQNSIPFYEKAIIKSLNYLLYSFLNIDALKYNPNIQTKQSIIDKEQNYDNSIFNNNLYELFKLSKQPQQQMSINLDILSREQKENLLLFLIFNPFTSTFTIQYSNKIYFISTQHEKNYLLQFLIHPYKTAEQAINYDEIYMPLPKTAKDFLTHIFTLTNPGCKIHLYDFMFEEEIKEYMKSDTCLEIIKHAKKKGKKVNIMSVRKVGQASPRRYRVCIDIEVEN